MNAVPLQLLLPDGPATLVPGSFERGVPRYARDGQVLDIDVSIPPDLQARWFWHGSFLRLRVAADECGVAIYTGTFPPPLCFDNARVIAPASVEAAPIQLTMELV